MLNKRSTPAPPGGLAEVKSRNSIFGGAKPRDEKAYEERRRKESEKSSKLYQKKETRHHHSVSLSSCERFLYS